MLAALCFAACAALAAPPAGAPVFDIERLSVLLELEEHQKPLVKSILEAQAEEMRTAFEQDRASGVRPSPEEMRQRHETLRQNTLVQLQGVLTQEQIEKFKVLTDRPLMMPKRQE
jgi:hypothetical protein